MAQKRFDILTKCEPRRKPFDASNGMPQRIQYDSSKCKPLRPLGGKLSRIKIKPRRPPKPLPVPKPKIFEGPTLPPRAPIKGDFDPKDHAVYVPNGFLNLKRRAHREEVSSTCFRVREFLKDCHRDHGIDEYIQELTDLYTATGEEPSQFFLFYLGKDRRRSQQGWSKLGLDLQALKKKPDEMTETRETSHHRSLKHRLLALQKNRLDNIPVLHVVRMGREISRLQGVLRDQLFQKLDDYWAGCRGRIAKLEDVSDWLSNQHTYIWNEVREQAKSTNYFEEVVETERIRPLGVQLSQFFDWFLYTVKQTRVLAKNLNLLSGPQERRDFSLRYTHSRSEVEAISSVDLTAKHCPVTLRDRDIPKTGLLLKSREKMDWALMKMKNILTVCTEMGTDSASVHRLNCASDLLSNMGATMMKKFEETTTISERVNDMHKKLADLCNILETGNQDLVELNQSHQNVKDEHNRLIKRLNLLVDNNECLETYLDLLKAKLNQADLNPEVVPIPLLPEKREEFHQQDKNMMKTLHEPIRMEQVKMKVLIHTYQKAAVDLKAKIENLKKMAMKIQKDLGDEKEIRQLRRMSTDVAEALEKVNCLPQSILERTPTITRTNSLEGFDSRFFTSVPTSGVSAQMFLDDETKRRIQEQVAATSGVKDSLGLNTMPGEGPSPPERDRSEVKFLEREEKLRDTVFLPSSPKGSPTSKSSQRKKRWSKAVKDIKSHRRKADSEKKVPEDDREASPQGKSSAKKPGAGPKSAQVEKEKETGSRPGSAERDRDSRQGSLEREEASQQRSLEGIEGYRQRSSEKGEDFHRRPSRVRSRQRSAERGELSRARSAERGELSRARSVEKGVLSQRRSLAKDESSRRRPSERRQRSSEKGDRSRRRSSVRGDRSRQRSLERGDRSRRRSSVRGDQSRRRSSERGSDSRSRSSDRDEGSRRRSSGKGQSSRQRSLTRGDSSRRKSSEKDKGSRECSLDGDESPRQMSPESKSNLRAKEKRRKSPEFKSSSSKELRRAQSDGKTRIDSATKSRRSKERSQAKKGVSAEVDSDEENEAEFTGGDASVQGGNLRESSKQAKGKSRRRQRSEDADKDTTQDMQEEKDKSKGLRYHKLDALEDDLPDKREEKFLELKEAAPHFVQRQKAPEDEKAASKEEVGSKGHPQLKRGSQASSLRRGSEASSSRRGSQAWPSQEEMIDGARSVYRDMLLQFVEMGINLAETFQYYGLHQLSEYVQAAANHLSGEIQNRVLHDGLLVALEDFFGKIEFAVRQALHDAKIHLTGKNLIEQMRATELNQMNFHALTVRKKQALISQNYQTLWIMHLHLCEAINKRNRGLPTSAHDLLGGRTDQPITSAEMSMKIPQDLLFKNTTMLDAAYENGKVSAKCMRTGFKALEKLTKLYCGRLPIVVKMRYNLYRTSLLTAAMREYLAYYAKSMPMKRQWMAFQQRREATLLRSEAALKKQMDDFNLKRTNTVFESWVLFNQICIETGLCLVLPEPRIAKSTEAHTRYGKVLSTIVHKKAVPNINSGNVRDILSTGKLPNIQSGIKLSALHIDNRSSFKLQGFSTISGQDVVNQK